MERLHKCDQDIANKACVSTYKNPSSPNKGSFGIATSTATSVASNNNNNYSHSSHQKSTMGLIRPMSNTTGNSPLLLVGTSTSGKVLIWDVAKDQGMDSLDVGEAIIASSSSTSSSCSRTNIKKGGGFYGRSSSSPTQPSQQQQYQSQTRITSMNISEHWWTISGGQRGPYQSLQGGFLATFHGPSRSLVSCTNTRECIQQIASLSTAANDAHDSRLVSVANEGVVSYWDSLYSLQRTHRVWTSPPSSKSIAVMPWTDVPNDNTIAIGGVGPTVDVLQDFCNTQTLTL